MGLVDWAVSNAAHRSIANLASRGLVKEGLYLAATTLAEGWQDSAARALASGFRKALEAKLGEGKLETWEGFLKFLSANEPDPNFLVRLAAQSPEGFERLSTLRAASEQPSERPSSRQLVEMGRRLLKAGMVDEGLSMLSAATYQNSTEAIPILRHTVRDISRRDIPVLSAEEARPVVRDLTTAVGQLASTGHYISALHTCLMEPLVQGNVNQFAQDSERMLTKAEQLGSATAARAVIDLGIELNHLGYRNQAVDLVTAASGIPYTDRSGWQEMYMATDAPQIIRSASTLAARLAQPVAASAGVDLSRPVRPARVQVSEAPAPPQRHVNAWVEENAGFAPDEFDVGINIGPKIEGGMGGPFREPDWGDLDHIDLRITLSGPDADVSPTWHDLRLPKTGKTNDVRFRVKTKLIGRLHLFVRIYTRDTNLLLDEHQLSISIADERQVA